MDVKRTSTEDLITVIEKYNAEMKCTKITKIDQHGRLYCPKDAKSGYTAQQAFDAYHEVLIRNERLNYERICTT
ncbi:MAG: hypothetical protein ACI9TY_000833 [Alphaproteobacteria bacterium]|jgi:hypothetical protein